MKPRRSRTCGAFFFDAVTIFCAMLGRVSDVADGSGGVRTLVTELRTGFGRFRTLVYADLPCMQSRLTSSKKIERVQHAREKRKSCTPRPGYEDSSFSKNQSRVFVALTLTISEVSVGKDLGRFL